MRQRICEIEWLGYIHAMKVGIIGARLSGSYAGLLLSQLGHEVVLFDHTTDREKPCGGGVTGKALSTISFFRGLRLPHTEIRTMRMAALGGHSAELTLRHPIHIYSRSVLDSSLRVAACRAGATFLAERALEFTKTARGWCVRTTGGVHELDFLIGADGAASSVRPAIAGRFTAADLSLALGFYLPGRHHPATIFTEFQEDDFAGYLWSFPRVDHASVGILQWLPAANAARLRRRVTEFIEARYPDVGEKAFYAARIPCLSRRRLLDQRVCGPDWALLGDAAGFADAITGEGIHYALRSAELLAQSIQYGNPLSYEALWREDFGPDLIRAARYRDRFYAGTLLFRAYTSRAIQAIRLSTTIGQLIDQLIAGRTDYAGFRRGVMLRCPQILVEAFCNLVRGGTTTRAEAPAEP